MGCPSLEEINGILQEEETSSRLNEFMSHLDSCHRCQAALAELSELPMDHDIGDIFTSPRRKSEQAQFEEPSSSFSVFPQEKSSRIGPLRIERKIGEGGMAEVFACYDERIDRKVAVKVIDANVITSRNLERLAQEARIHAQLKHPNVVSLLEFEIDNGLPYLVMELVEGGTLKDLFRAPGVKPRQLAELMRDVALAVQAAHDLDILHRDLKPANILLQRSNRSGWSDPPYAPTGNFLVPKVSDFGLAKLMDSETNLSASAMYLGTPAYMSPEQTLGDTKRIGKTADVYAMGVILYEGLTGRLPFAGEDLTDLFGRIRQNAPIKPSELQPGVPQDLETICLKCLEKDPFQRYRTAGELADELTRYLSGNPISARPIGPIRQLIRLAKANPFVAMVVAIFICEVLVFAYGYKQAADRESKARKVAEVERQVAEIAADKLEYEADELRTDYANLKEHFFYAIDQAHSNSIEMARLISRGANESELRKFQKDLVHQRGELGDRIIPDLDDQKDFDAFLVLAYYLSGINELDKNHNAAAAERFTKSVEKARSCLASGKKVDIDTRYYALRSFNLLAELDIDRGDFEAGLAKLREAWDNFASHGDDFELTRAVKVMSLQTAFRMQHCLEALGRFDEARPLSVAIEAIERVAVPIGDFDVDKLF